MTTYVLVPGYVIARDGDQHYINARQLQRLYRVNPAYCIEAPTGPRSRGWKPPADAVFLYPRRDGDYSLPTAPTTATDWKALCAELAKELAEEYGVQREFDSGDPLLGSGAIELLSRARTALGQPEPEEPTDEGRELQWPPSVALGCHEAAVEAEPGSPLQQLLIAAGDLLESQWGRPAVEPEPGDLTEEELLRTYGLAKRDHCYEGPIDDWPKRAERAATVHGLRAVIAADRARWGRPAVETETNGQT